MGAEDPKGFVIRDRRARADEGGPSAERDTQSAPPGREAEVPPFRDPAHAAEAGLPVTFSSFVFSLGTSALMLMGEQLDPQQGTLPVNLSQAKEIIDILSVLKDKTRGNLTAEEQSVLDDMLYALRMKYVNLTSPHAGPGARQASKFP